MVPAHLSDLFFNHDTSSARAGQYSQTNEQGFDFEKLRDEASTVLATVRGIMTTMTVNDLPSPEELAEDFLSRI